MADLPITEVVRGVRSIADSSVFREYMVEEDVDTLEAAIQALESVTAPTADLPVPATPLVDEIATAVFEAFGAVSVCWSSYPSLGVFDATAAKKIGDELMAKLSPFLSPIPATGEVEWGGQIVTASFEDGQVRAPYCGLEDCECPDHEGSPSPAGTYITIRLDEDHAVGLRRVIVREVSS